MAISIVNRYTFSTVSTNTPATLAINPVAAGNTVVIVQMSGNYTSLPSLNGVSASGFGGGAGSFIGWWTALSGGQNSISWPVNPNPSFAVVFELTPCVNDSSSGNIGFTSATDTATAITASQANELFISTICAANTGGSWSAVSGPWVINFVQTGGFNNQGGTHNVAGAVALISSGSGTQQAAWTDSGSSGHLMGFTSATFISTAPPTPPGLACAVKDGGGNTLSTFINDLGVNIAPATQLYESFVPPSVINTSEYDTEGRTGIVMDFNSGDGLYSRDLGTAFTWAISNRLILYVWQPSLISMPENQFNRPTDWDDGGNAGAKFIQGIIVEADSFNSAKTFQLQSADDLSLHPLNEMPAIFPKQTTKAFSCLTPFIAHSVRIVATDGIPWRMWHSNLVFEPWPEQTTNWQTEQTSFGLAGWLHSREMNIAYASANPITVVLVFDAWPTITLQLPSSGGPLVQAKVKQTLPANKFKLVSVRVFSSGPFFLFEQDLEFKVKQWGSTGPFNVLKVLGGPSKTGAAV